MKRISRNLTAAALASSLTMAGVAAASAEENTELNGNDLVDTALTATENGTEGGKTEGGKTEGENGAGETGKTDGENSKDPIVPIKAPAEGNNKKPTGENKPGNNGTPGKDENKPGNNNADNKEKSSFDDFKSKLSSEEGKPTDLGIAGIVLGVLGAIAAVAPAAAKALGIKLPF